MKNHASVLALAIIIVALVGCSKKSVDTSITQQRAPDGQVVTVTNDGHVYRIRSGSITNTMRGQKASGGPVRTNWTDGGFVNRLANVTNSTRATNGISK